MPVVLEFEEPSLFIVRASGAVTFEDSRQVLVEILSNPKLGAGAAILIDNKDVTSTPSVGEIAVITSLSREIFTRGVAKLAILADSEPVHGIANLFASFASTMGSDVRVFRDLQGARRWLFPEPP